MSLLHEAIIAEKYGLRLTVDQMADAQIATMFEKVARLGYTQRDLPAFTSGVVCAEVHHKIIKGKP